LPLVTIADSSRHSTIKPSTMRAPLTQIEIMVRLRFDTLRNG
jgi:hypothetical protein